MNESEPSRRAQQIRWAASVLAFLIGSAAVILLMLPSAWGIAAGLLVGGAAGAGTYGTLYGREIKAQEQATLLTTEQEALREQLKQTETTVRTRQGELPPSTHGQLRMMVVGLDEIIQRWEALRRAPEQQDAVAMTVRRHLPRTLDLFLELPDTAKPEHAEEFKAQVSLMAEAVAKTRDDAVGKDLQALRRNRLLLEEALTDPDERLFRDL
ncbi:hypothetical protein [Nesterenkonia populi]|uniref:hypothetical protein n=1 Tax=Nesterenkonia populi TaxID=1591087 RepID=UPI0011BF105D|nr:hypothetical protein [Nesterenkonia populi]